MEERNAEDINFASDEYLALDDDMTTDEHLEGTGSGFEDDEDGFPMEWTILDYAEEDKRPASGRERAVRTRKDERPAKREKSSERHTRESADRKKDDNSTVSRRKRDRGSSQDRKSRISHGTNRLESSDRSRDRKTKDSHSHRSHSRNPRSIDRKYHGRKSRSVDKKLDSSSRKRKHDSQDHKMSKSKDKETNAKSEDKRHDSHHDQKPNSSKEAHVKNDVEVEGTTKAKLDEQKEIEAMLMLKKIEENEEAIPTEFPLPMMPTNFNLFTKFMQSSRCRLVTGGSNNPPEVLPVIKNRIDLTKKYRRVTGGLDNPPLAKNQADPTKKDLRWNMRIFPVYWADLAKPEMTKVFNQCAQFSLFMFRSSVPSPKYGDMSLMLFHHNHGKEIFLQLEEMQMVATNISIFVNKRRNDETFETAEVKFRLKVNHNLKPLPRQKRSVVEGYLPERIIGLQDIPEGTSVEMVEVMFPLSEVAEITYIKSGKGEVTGSTTIKFRNPGFVKKVHSCYEELRIGNKKITITFPRSIEKQFKAAEQRPPRNTVTDIANKVTGLPVIAKKSHGADGNVGDMHKDIDELRLQRWTVEQKALLLKQENLMAIQEQQETALMAARMMASAPPPVFLGPPPVPQNYILPVAPEGVPVDNPQHLMMLEQQKRQQMQQESLVNTDFEQSFNADHDDIDQSRLKETDEWCEEQSRSLSPFDRRYNDRDRFDYKEDRFSEREPCDAEDIHGRQRLQNQTQELKWNRTSRARSDHDAMDDSRRPRDRMCPDRTPQRMSDKMLHNDEDLRGEVYSLNRRMTDQDREMMGQDRSDRKMPPRDVLNYDVSHRELQDQDLRERDGSRRNMLEVDGSHRDLLERDGSHRDLLERDGPHRNFRNHDGSRRDLRDRDGARRDLRVRDGAHRDLQNRDGSRRDRDGTHRDLRDRDESFRDLRDCDGSRRDLRDHDRTHQDLRDRDKSLRDLQDHGGSRRDRDESLRDLQDHGGSRRDLRDRDESLRDLQDSGGSRQDRDESLRDLQDRDDSLRDLQDRGGSRRDLQNRDMLPRNVRDRDVSNSNMLSRDMQDLDYKIPRSGLQESGQKQQLDELDDQSYNRFDPGMALYGTAQGRTSLKRQNQFDSMEPVPAKRSMSGSGSFSGFLQSDDGVTRQASGIHPPPMPPHSLVLTSNPTSSTMTTFPMANFAVPQQMPAALATFPLQPPLPTMGTFPQQPPPIFPIQQQMVPPLATFPVQQPSVNMANLSMQQNTETNLHLPPHQLMQQRQQQIQLQQQQQRFQQQQMKARKQ